MADLNLGKMSLDLEANLEEFKRNMQAGRGEADEMQGALRTIVAVAEVTQASLSQIKITASQASESGSSAEGILAGVKGISDEARSAARELDNVRITDRQAAESDAAGDVIDTKLNEISHNAEQATRQLEQLKIANTFDGGGGPTIGGTNVGLIAGALGAITLALPAVAPALVGLLGTIPIMGAAAAGVIGTLALAFDGVGAAIKGNQKAYNELQPAQQQFVQSVRSLSGWFDTLKQTAAGATFPEFNSALHSTLSPGTVGAVTQAIKEFGQAIGTAAEQWGRYFGSPEFQSIFGPLMQAGARAWNAMSTAVLDLFDAFGTLGRAAIPLTSWLMQEIDLGSKWLDNWIHAKDATGQLADAMNSAKTSLQLVGGLIESLWKVVVSLGEALYPVSQVFVKDLTDGLTALAKIIHDNQGAIREVISTALTGFVEIVKLAAAGVKAVTDELSKFIGKKDATIAVISAIGIALSLALGPESAAILGVLLAAGLITNHWDAIKTYFSTDFLPAMGDFAKELGKLLLEPITLAAEGILSVIHKLLQALSAVINQIPNSIFGISTGAGSLKAALDSATGTIDSWNTDLHKTLDVSFSKMGTDLGTALGQNAVTAINGQLATITLPAIFGGGTINVPGVGGGSTADAGILGGSPLTTSPSTVGGVSFSGKSLVGENTAFIQAVAEAVSAAGGSAVNVTSARRPPGKGNDVKDSNHITGNALDGFVITSDGSQVPIGQFILQNAGQFGLRSGDVKGFDPVLAKTGGYDNVHVDDGANVGGAASGAAISKSFGLSGSYFQQVLQGLGITPTAANLQLLNQWANQEGISQKIDPFNLLGTTLPVGLGSHGTNSAGVQAYPNQAAGIEALVAELNQSNFAPIKKALASGNPAMFMNDPTVQAAFKIWSTGSATGKGGYTWPGGSSSQVPVGGGTDPFGSQPAWSTPDPAIAKAKTAAEKAAAKAAARVTKITDEGQSVAGGAADGWAKLEATLGGLGKSADKQSADVTQAFLGGFLPPEVAAELQGRVLKLKDSIATAGSSDVSGIKQSLATLKSTVQDGLRQGLDDKNVRALGKQLQDDMDHGLITQDQFESLGNQLGQLNSVLTDGFLSDSARKAVEGKIKDLKEQLKLDLSLDAEHKQLVGDVAQLNQDITDGLMPPAVAAIAKAQSEQIGKDIASGTAAGSVAAKAGLKELAATLKEGVEDATAISNYQTALSQFALGIQEKLGEAMGRPESYATPSALSAAEAGAARVMAAIAQGMTGPALDQAKSQLAGFQHTIEDAMNGMLQTVNDDRSLFEDAWGKIASAGDAVFQRSTSNSVTLMQNGTATVVAGMQKLTTAAVTKMQTDLQTALAAMQITVTGSGIASFLFGGAITQTPTEALIAQMQSDWQKQQDQASVDSAQSQLDADNAAQADAATLKSDQQALDAALYQQKLDSLQTQAALERTAADSQLKAAQDSYTAQQNLAIQAFQDKQDLAVTAYQAEQAAAIQAYQDDRDLVQQAMDDQVAAVEKGFEDGNIDASTAFDELKGIYQDNGVDITGLAVDVAGSIYDGVSSWTVPLKNLMDDLTDSITQLSNASAAAITTASDTLTSVGQGGIYQSGSGTYGYKPVPLATGGIVLPRPGGTHAILAEAGRPEAVIPLDQLGGGSAGGEVHVHVGTVIGTGLDQAARELAQPLLGELRKHGQRNVKVRLS